MPHYIAVKHRAAGSPSVHFGPFATLAELFEWATKNGLTVAVVELTDPDSSPDEWWS